jgi:hypothetical protein
MVALENLNGENLREHVMLPLLEKNYVKLDQIAIVISNSNIVYEIQNDIKGNIIFHG